MQPMAERDLELRLRAAAHALDADAPAFDVGRLRASPRRSLRKRAALACVAALVAIAVAPAAVSALRHVFEVDDVTELGPLAPGVAPPYAGISVPVADLDAAAPFRVRRISSLGPVDEARVRTDITGGMVTLVYRGGILLTQWRSADVSPRIALVPIRGTAEDVAVGSDPALWVAGEARGTFTLIGADGGVHRESFEVARGALLWRDDELIYLLQGALSKASAVELAESVDR
jgi:hypothetical protein